MKRPVTRRPRGPNAPHAGSRYPQGLTLAAIQVEAGYPRREVLRGVSCAAQPGRVTAVLGPNGAGKSTLLRVLLGALTPRAGRVELDGMPVAALPARARAARLALVPQATTPGTAYSVLQTVRLGRLAFGEPAAAVTRVAEAALHRVGLHNRRHDPLGSLSAGQQQRALLARALAQLGLASDHARSSPPAGGRFLLADEPVASMDPRFAIESMQVLREVAGAGPGVLVVVHDFALAAEFADDAILMDAQGRAVAAGTAADVLTPERLGAVFGARFAMVSPGAGHAAFPHPVATGRDQQPCPHPADTLPSA